MDLEFQMQDNITKQFGAITVVKLARYIAIEELYQKRSPKSMYPRMLVILQFQVLY